MAEKQARPSIKFCIFCECELKVSKRYRFCLACRDGVRSFKIPTDSTSEYVERHFKDVMRYCYYCGKELIRDEGYVRCIDGCQLVNIDLILDGCIEVIKESLNIFQSHGGEPDYGMLMKLGSQLKYKWRELGEQLQVERLELDELSEHESYTNVINTWQQKRTVPYTWDVFLQALHAIKEGAMVTIGKDIEDSTCIKDLFSYSRNNWMLPNIQIEDCKYVVDFFVVLDLLKWRQESELFNLSISLPEICQGWAYFGNFKCIYQVDTRCIYHCCLPIPPELMLSRKEGKKIFCYKYVVTKIGAHSDIIPKYETLSFGINTYRYIIVDKSKAHFDNEIRPVEGIGWFSRTKPVDVATTAMAMYMDWAIEKRQLTYVNTSEIEKEIFNNSGLLSHMICCLQQCCLIDTYGIEETRNNFKICEVVLKKLCIFLSKQDLSLMQRFLSCLIVVNTIVSTGIFDKNMKYFKNNLSVCKIILQSLYIPPNEYIECVKIIISLSPDLILKTVATVAIALSNILIASSPSSHEWIGVLPLLHIVTSDDFVPGQPYQLPSTERELYKVLFCGINTESVISTKNFASNTQAQLFFKHDWLMPRALFVICPHENIITFVQDYPETATFACFVIALKYEQLLKKLHDFNTLLQLLISIIVDRIVPIDDFALFQKGACQLVEKSFKTRVQCPQLFKTSVQLFLTFLDKIVSLQWDNEKKKHMTFLNDYVHEWISLVYGHELTSAKVMNELKDWSAFFSFEMNDVIRQEWSRNPKIADRFSQITLQDKLKILPSTNDIHQNVTDMLLSSVIPSIIESKDNDAFKSLQNATSNNKLKVIRAFLSLEYPNMVVLFKSLFTPVWQMILELYESMQITQQKGTSVYSMCEQALHLLKQFFNNLQVRQITPSELEDILHAGDIVTTLKIVHSLMSMDLFKDDSLTVKMVEQELRAYQSFKLRNTHLLHFSDIFFKVSEGPMKLIKDAIKSDYSRTPVQLLWEWKSEEDIYYKFCPVDVPADVLKEVYQLTHPEGCMSTIFHKLFVNQSRVFASNFNDSSNSIAPQNIIYNLWKPLCNEFNNDIRKLCNGLQLPLVKVKYLFQNISDLQALAKELNICSDIINEADRNWVDNAAQVILDYQELCKYSFASTTLMQLKEAMGLTGDFSALIAVMPNEECQKTISEITLATIEKTAICTALILKDISSEDHRKNCLEVFCMCMSLVNWIRSVSINVGQLHSVIQIAIQTTEEGSMKELLKNILQFGCAFAPFIFNVDKGEGCEALVNRCKSLWLLLVEYPHIVQTTMDSCYVRLGELNMIHVDAIHQIQESLARELFEINTKGVYHIEAIPGKVIHSQNEMIKLKLADGQNKGAEYNLIDLRKLHSRFVLIAAHERKSFLKFVELLFKIEKIAVLLVKLQEAAYVEYTHFRLVCGCNEYNRKEFDKVITSMEKALQEWNNSAEQYRKQYPHLNYYTSQQLFDLQHELGQMRSHHDLIPSQNLKQLLLSVTPYPHHSKIIAALNMFQPIPNVEVNNVSPFNVPKKDMQIYELTDKQKVILTNIKESFGFSTRLILDAFSRLGKTNEEDIVEWCNENYDLLGISFDSESSFDEETESSDDFDKEDIAQLCSDNISHNYCLEGHAAVISKVPNGHYLKLQELGQVLAILADIEGFTDDLQEKELNKMVLEIEDISLPIDTCIG